MNGSIDVTLSPNDRHAYVTGLWQYDYGQKLIVRGLDLPKAIEVHFSDSDRSGTAETRVGVTSDREMEVGIPNALLELPKMQDYDIYAYIYVTDKDSGHTEYKIRMTVRARPKPGEEHPDTEQDHPLADAVQAVCAAADQAEAASAEASESKAAAERAADRAEKSAQYANEARAVAEAANIEAEGWAEAAKQIAVKNGFCQLEVNDSGHLILKRTDNLVDLLDFCLTDAGHLEVVINDD